MAKAKKQEQLKKLIILRITDKYTQEQQIEIATMIENELSKTDTQALVLFGNSVKVEIGDVETFEEGKEIGKSGFKLNYENIENLPKAE